ncbi:hypothetical protein QYF36_016870 [Acer negundo]|nr:hypothetical protein QYF36_016870 [Acer negundo]
MEKEEEEEENEEEKMEQFYALLRNTKDVRDRLRSSSTTSTGLHGSPIPSIPSMEINNNNNNNKQDQEKKKQLEEKALSAVWNPSFQPEDFMDDRNVIAKSNTLNLGSTSSTQLAASASQEEKEEPPQQQQQQQQQQQEDDKKDGGNDNNNLDLDLNLSL